jgi:hypothetical protein
MRLISPRPIMLRALAPLTLAIAALGVAACGSSSSTEPTKLAVTISDAGKGKFTMDAPTQIDGGLVEMTLANQGKEPHQGQLVLLSGGHTVQDALSTIGSQSSKIPSWMKLEGGVGVLAPGQSGTATMNLPAGNYGIIDLGGGPGGGKPPALSGSQAEMTVGSGDTGDLPATNATVTADKVGKDRYRWDVSGLKAGANTVTFNSKGSDAVHHIVAAPIVGNASIGDVKSALESNSGPPPVNPKGIQETTVLDGGNSQTTQFDLKPGRYAFVCFLTDRDGGKPHFEEGLLKQVTIPKS